MNVPFDNIYDFIEGRLQIPAVFYLFYPPGSRKISDLGLLHDYHQQHIVSRPRIICHDQEPLNFSYYSDESAEMQCHKQQVNDYFKQYTGIGQWLYLSQNNLNLGTYHTGGISLYDRTVLLHSELNSDDAAQYAQHGYELAYWWSHAMIARDWYRFAQIDHRLQHRRMRVPFLIYARGFTGQREYRLKFVEKLVHAGILPYCKLSMLHEEQGQSIYEYRCQDHRMQVHDPDLFQLVPQCQAGAAASASYDVDDITSTALSVVCETQFLGSKIHLTEKILRPLACGHPFMLLAGPGALAVLRRYGFDTYYNVIDEGYDLESDPVIRMDMIVQELHRLKNFTPEQWRQWHEIAKPIAQRNQERFFSDEFQQQLLDELLNNLVGAVYSVTNTRGTNWLENRRRIRHAKPENWHEYLHRDNERLKASVLRRHRRG